MEEKKRLKIPRHISTQHEIGDAEWAAATNTILTSHESHPRPGIVLNIPGKEQRKITVRADAQGDLYLEFD